MSQDSVSSLQLEQEIQECSDSVTKLLDYSTQPGTLILPTNTEDHNNMNNWSDMQRKTIQDHVRYHEQMISVLKNIEGNGRPVEQLPRLPKRPGTKLDVLLQSKRGKRVLSPEELHNYLVSQQADVAKRISVEAFTEDYFKCGSEAEIVAKLQKGFRNLLRCHAQTLMISIQFGRFLNMAKEWHGGEYEKGNITQNWTEWLKANTGYSDQHARKLREVANIIGGYPQFFFVRVSFNWIYSKKTELKAMLKIPQYHELWSEPFVLATHPAELPQSQ